MQQSQARVVLRPGFARDTALSRRVPSGNFTDTDTAGLNDDDK